MAPESRSSLHSTTDIAHQRVVVAGAAFYLAQVERACGLDGCLDAHCRVRDSLRSSLESERAHLAELEGMGARAGILELAS